MSVTNIVIEKYHKVSDAYHKVDEAKHRSNPYRDATEMILSISKFDTRSGNILSFLLPLFQEGQLSVTGESMCTKYWLTA